MVQSLEGMDLLERVREVARRVEGRLDRVETEEATKTALVMPFIGHVLGYNVFDPSEVVPEFVADVGIKKGERVDYAILRDDAPVMIFECKKYGADLGINQASQLYRYFSVTQARFGVLTDGVTYWFFSDLEEPNKMDSRPFFVLDLTDFDDLEVEELRRFTKASFDVDKILSTAKDLKYIREIKGLLARECAEPSEELARFFAGQVYEGMRTRTVVEQFKGVTKRALEQFITDEVNSRLRSAMRRETPDPDDEPGADAEQAGQPGIVTTEEEVQGYLIVKAIVSQDIPPERVAIRDRQTYCGILLDDNNRKPICRLFFDSGQKYLGLINEDRSVERVPIDSPEGIYGYADRLRDTVRRYDAAR